MQASGQGQSVEVSFTLTAEMVEQLTRLDPLFPVNNQRHPSRGESCRAGLELEPARTDLLEAACAARYRWAFERLGR